MNVSDADKKRVRLTLLAMALGLYVLEAVLINPMIVWTAMPLIIGYLIINKAWNRKSQKKLRQGYAFLALSIGFSFLYHLMWFFDVDHTKTGGSTSALIFVWFPIYAVILGFIGYLFGALAREENEVN
jgi:hypothetical protein